MTQSEKYDLGFVQSSAAKLLTNYVRYLTRPYFELQPAECTSLPGPREGQTYVLYAHVPFCESLCPYCSFNRFLFNEDRAVAYFRNLRAEMRMTAKLGYQFASMYIGGGTPTILIDELVETIDLAKELFGIPEVSCETNPNHLTPEILGKLKGRVDRLSVGVQSFDDDLLKQMSRYDRFGSGQQVFENIRNAAGILPSLNVDMIFNFPSQTEEILRADIQRIIESGAEQCTFYPLMSAPSVKYAMDRSVGRVDYDREGRFYKLIANELGKVYTPLSAWTFSREDTHMIDEYIVKYEEYVGIGSGSFSYLDGTLYVNTFSVTDYNKAIESGKMSVMAKRHYAKTQQMQYRFMMELFDLKLNKKTFKEDFGVSVERGLWKETLFLDLLGSFDRQDNQLLLKPENRYLLVILMREFFTGVNLLRDQARARLSKSEQLMCVANQTLIHS
ncbi:MAG TPA: coproporphyrinogen III oxidase family protein [Bellilinea sp.]|jgi:coproporphyrinogen III oxidase-like Fe-S oxidoreductase|nr:coproporphyrinogen III oxidase family protein [Bellilinea sp.]